MAIAGDDGSVVLAGWTFGDWCRTSLGFADFAAIKLDANGSVIWRWQVHTEDVYPNVPGTSDDIRKRLPCLYCSSELAEVAHAGTVGRKT